MTGDIEIPEGKDVTLDLNGKTVNGDIAVIGGSKLTIIDSSDPKTGKVTGMVKANTGEVIIKAGQFDKKPTATDPGTVSIEGGKFKEDPIGDNNGVITADGK